MYDTAIDALLCGHKLLFNNVLMTHPCNIHPTTMLPNECAVILLTFLIYFSTTNDHNTYIICTILYLDRIALALQIQTSPSFYFTIIQQ